MSKPVFRAFTLRTTSRSACGLFLQSLILCNGQITGMFYQGDRDNRLRYSSTFYMLQFADQSGLDMFHGKGYVTSEPEKATVS
jgi:hypothetical protein